MKSEDKSNISDHLNEYDFKKLKIKFLDKDEIKIFSTLCQDGIFSFDKSKYISQFETVPYIKKNKKIFAKDYKNIGNSFLKLLHRPQILMSLQKKLCLNYYFYFLILL